MREIIDQEELKRALEEHEKVILDFYADWCGPCTLMSPIVTEAAKEMPEVLFVKINIDKAPAVVRQYEIMSIPTLVMIRGGKVLGTHVGFAPKHEVLDAIKIIL